MGIFNRTVKLLKIKNFIGVLHSTFEGHNINIVIETDDKKELMKKMTIIIDTGEQNEKDN